jgi:hypothetical protein
VALAPLPSWSLDSDGDGPADPPERPDGPSGPGGTDGRGGDGGQGGEGGGSGPGASGSPIDRLWNRFTALTMEQLVTGVLTLVGVTVAVVFVWLQLQPHLLLADTLPSGGDMGAHVWGPAYLRRELLPHLRLSGWTPDWYAGFPAYHYYMVLPSLFVLLLDALPFVPYGIAFKLVTVSGLVALPVSAWAMARLFGLRYPGPALFAFATLPFIFDTRFTIYGGNAASTLAGEFAFSISLALVLVYLGVVARGLDTGRHRAIAAVLFALILLCHLLPAIFAVAATVVLALWKLWPSWKSTLLWVVPVGVVGVVLAGFWAVPFLFRHAYFNDMGWERTQTYFENLGPGTKGSPAVWFGVFALAIVGVVLSIIERNLLGGFLTSMAVVSAIAFVSMPQSAFWNARVLPFYYLSVYLLAGLGVTLFIQQVPSLGGQSVAAVGAALVVLVVVGLPLGVVPGHRDLVNGKYTFAGAKVTPSFVDDWARWNYTGYERKPAYPEYQAVVNTMAQVGQTRGCGRAMWEYQTDKLNSYGTPMALMLLPYWTKGCIGSMEGLYFESSATTPFHFLNQSELSEKPSSAQRNLPYRGFDIQEGVEHLQLMGVKYYMALSDRAKTAARSNADLTFVTSSGPWEVFEVLHSELVTPLEYEPAVLPIDQDQKSWLPQATSWYNDPSRWAVPLAATGPSAGGRQDGDACGGDGWQRVAVGQAPERCPVTPAVVSNIDAGNDTVSFDVDRVGSPVLVKVSYFPNWKVSGGKGPYRVTPNLMVVVPTANHVELHYGRSGLDWAGMALTLLGIAGVVALAKMAPLAVKKVAPRAAAASTGAIDLSPYQLTYVDGAGWAPVMRPSPSPLLPPRPGAGPEDDPGSHPPAGGPGASPTGGPGLAPTNGEPSAPAPGPAAPSVANGATHPSPADPPAAFPQPVEATTQPERPQLSWAPPRPMWPPSPRSDAATSPPEVDRPTEPQGPPLAPADAGPPWATVPGTPATPAAPGTSDTPGVPGAPGPDEPAPPATPGGGPTSRLAPPVAPAGDISWTERDTSMAPPPGGPTPPARPVGAAGAQAGDDAGDDDGNDDGSHDATPERPAPGAGGAASGTPDGARPPGPPDADPPA